ncbi:MAG: hypothetical protein PHS37_04010 [Candidatus Omnitrophica bacterium]|nr:hypothetical protein [Candidatus Omnitrophota bacterium]
MIIHIQDAHCNYYAQQRIHEIIEYVNEKYGISVINLEGGAEDYDLDVFTRIREKDLRKEVADYFVKQGMVGGAEFSAINRPDKYFLWGIEDPRLYAENLSSYRDSLRYRADSDRAVASLDHVLSNLKRKIFSKDLAEFDVNYERYRTETLEFKLYVRYLIETAMSRAVEIKRYPNILCLSRVMSLEAGINFSKANIERGVLVDKLEHTLSQKELDELAGVVMEYRKQKVTEKDFYIFLVCQARSVGITFEGLQELAKYVRYIDEYQKIDKSALMGEIALFEDDVKAVLCSTDDEKAICRLSQNLLRLKRMLATELTLEDYRYYEAHKDEFGMDYFKKRLEPYVARYRLQVNREDLGVVDLLRSAMERFYRCSFKRDDAFIRNMKFAGKTRAAILVTGGFHTESLTKMFKENGIAYVSLVPAFTSDKGYQCPYFRLLRGETDAVDEAIRSVLAGRNLAIASFLNANLSEVLPQGDVVRTAFRIYTEYETERVKADKQIAKKGRAAKHGFVIRCSGRSLGIDWNGQLIPGVVAGDDGPYVLCDAKDTMASLLIDELDRGVTVERRGEILTALINLMEEIVLRIDFPVRYKDVLLRKVFLRPDNTPEILKKCAEIVIRVCESDSGVTFTSMEIDRVMHKCVDEKSADVRARLAKAARRMLEHCRDSGEDMPEVGFYFTALAMPGNTTMCVCHLACALQGVLRQVKYADEGWDVVPIYQPNEDEFADLVRLLYDLRQHNNVTGFLMACIIQSLYNNPDLCPTPEQFDRIGNVLDPEHRKGYRKDFGTLVTIVVKRNPAIISERDVHALETSSVDVGLQNYSEVSLALTMIRNSRKDLIREGSIAAVKTALPEKLSDFDLSCWRVYNNPTFKQMSQGLSDTEQYSLASAAHNLLLQHGRDPSNEHNISAALEYVSDEWRRIASLGIPLFQGREVVNILALEFAKTVTPDQTELECGASAVSSFYKDDRVIEDGLSIVRDRGRAHLPLAVYIFGHGTGNIITVGKSRIPFSIEQLGDALLARGNCGNVVIFAECCFGYNFLTGLSHYMDQKGATEFPVMITRGNMGRETYFADEIHRVRDVQARKPAKLTLNDMPDIAEESLQHGFTSVFAPVDQSRLERFLNDTQPAPGGAPVPGKNPFPSEKMFQAPLVRVDRGLQDTAGASALVRDGSKLRIDHNLTPLDLSSPVEINEAKKKLTDFLSAALLRARKNLFGGDRMTINMPGNLEIEGVTLAEKTAFLNQLIQARKEAGKKVMTYQLGNITINFFDDTETGQRELLEKMREQASTWGVAWDSEAAKRRVITFSFLENQELANGSFTVYLKGTKNEGVSACPLPVARCFGAAVSIYNLLDLTRPDREKPDESLIDKAENQALHDMVAISGISDDIADKTVEELKAEVGQKGITALSGKVWITIRPVNWSDIIAYHAMETEVMRAL